MIKTELTIDEHGTKYWYKNGKPHREDGPAVEYLNGAKYWYKHGLLHREDGPAVEHSIGRNYWYINDMEIFPKENLIEIPETEEEMLEVFNQYKFVVANCNYYFINHYIKEFKKDWYEKYRLLFK